MPILAYETSGTRKQMTKTIEMVKKNQQNEEDSNEVSEYTGNDELLLQGYLEGTKETKETKDTNPKPLHCRRTLDQFSYYMLDTTESRDRSQVIYRWGRKKLEKEPQ